MANNIDKRVTVEDLRTLWDYFYTNYIEVDPKASLGDWNDIFHDFLMAPKETLEYYEHYYAEDPNEEDPYNDKWHERSDFLYGQLLKAKEKKRKKAQYYVTREGFVHYAKR